MADRTTTIDIPAYDFAPSWLVGATTLAVDRIVPNVELIYQPAIRHGAGSVQFRLDGEPAEAWPPIRTSRKQRILGRFRPLQALDLGNNVFFDARLDDYFNWSHQVNFYLTLAIAARDWVGKDLTVVLRPGLPSIATQLYRMLGFQVVASDGPVRGRQCHWSVSHWEVVAAGRKLLAPGDYELPHCVTPAKIFLARRGSRAILNEAELECELPGFIKLYAEDMTPAEQFALFRNASDIVAIHGAALAPLQYRPSDAGPLRLVEISPVGHVTRWFGMMCHQVGGTYVGVRGRLKPEYVPFLYEKGPYSRHSSDRFEVDPLSLRIALDIVRDAKKAWPASII